ncbi:MAG: thiamine-phosphate kinase [Muribaculaceae bacterium]|nr:thiamine-phosphate kinase [Muribaculaceae bacterium]
MATEISSLGEFGLIDRLTREFPLVNESSVLGVGDDAAVIRVPSDKELLVTTDLLLEGIHFDVRYVPLMHLGYKAAVVNFSDVYAMNGTPKQITVSIGVSSRFTVEHIDAIYAGIRIACENYGVDLVGGDTSASVTGLVISVTCLGEVEKGKAVKRGGAQETNLICVSGDLGAAYMGLQLLERENTVAAQSGDPNFQPNFSGKEYILQRQLRPEARKDIIEKLREAGIVPTAMMDVSDGLSSELLHICKASDVGCRVYEDRIPIDYQTALMAEELNMNLVTAAMNGGEDYELLFTVPLTDKEKIERIDGVRMIGYITAPQLGAALVTRDGGEIPIRAQGWNAFNNPAETEEVEVVEETAGTTAPTDTASAESDGETQGES